MTDSQNHAPIAAQLLKKAQRLSLAGANRSSQGFRGSSSFEQSKRRSTLLLTPAQNKRLSGYGMGQVPSSISQHGNSVSYLAPQHQSSTPYSLQSYMGSQNGPFQAAQRKTDPRPLRDKNYQNLILKEIFDFCVANKFDLDTNHSVTMRTLKQPTQKDFVLLFQFLYNKIDPNYRFSRSIESEVFALLKMLNYPYLDGINRSSVSAVGGQNWPTFLGMLYWLVNLNITLQNLDHDSLVAPDDIFDKIFIKYIFSSYKAFIEQEENYDEFYQHMQGEYRTELDKLDRQIQLLSLEKQLLSAEYERLNQKNSELEEAEAKSHALENDLRQFSEYMQKMKERQSQWAEILEKMQAEINNAQGQLHEHQELKKRYEGMILQNGFSIQDVDKLNVERDKLSKAIDMMANRIEDLKDNLAKKNTELLQSHQSLESFVGQYNSMTLRFPVDNGSEYHLALNPALLEENGGGVDADHVLNRKLREEKIKLLLRRSELNQEVLDIQEESIKIVEHVDQLSEKIFEQQEEIEGLEAEVAKNKATQEEMYETMVSEGTSYSAQIEKLDRDLQGMQISANKGVIEAETRNKNLKIQLQELKYTLKEKREQLHETVHSLLQYVIMFKLTVQENFEELERQVAKELEAEERS